MTETIQEIINLLEGEACDVNSIYYFFTNREAKNINTTKLKARAKKYIDTHYTACMLRKPRSTLSINALVENSIFTYIQVIDATENAEFYKYIDMSKIFELERFSSFISCESLMYDININQ